MGVFFVLPLQDWERSGKLFWILALQRMFQAERAEKIKDDMETSNKKESFDLLESLIGFSRWVKRSLTCFFRWAGMAVVWVFRMQIRYFFVFLKCWFPFRTQFGFGLSFDNSQSYRICPHEQVEPMRAGEKPFCLFLVKAIEF